ncbi:MULTISPECIES: Ig-like domain-containing protein [Methanobacterium]|uniref:Ig-like domain-containing protein n=1 Tax=Methanobacterium veterum TaxID=408577 RepID=A0A9E5A103_9EURY|nr:MULTISPECIES: Ig-like domain-containing protein [Methanobacterium]MCZ3371214.1 Ig-like domain-containing protein [Methanobacterium veterum]
MITLVFLFSIVFTVLSTVNTVSADQSIIYVSDLTGNDSWNGESSIWDDLTMSGPKKSIKNATGTVTSGGTINIANGHYSGENNTDVVIDKNMTIVGERRGNTIINGTGSAQIFTIQKGINVIIKNLTFVNGTATQNLTLADKNITAGGAICNFGNLTIVNSTFRGNTATSEYISKNHSVAGGAVYNVGDLTVTGSDFINNAAKGNLIGNNGTVGGSIFNIGNLTVDTSNFTGNSATAGGAIYNLGVLTVLNSIFTGNTAAGNNVTSGGAIYNEYNSTLNLNGGILNIYGSTFTGNHASGNGTSGGGAIGNEKNLTIKNSTFTGNKVISTGNTAMGGAIFNIGNLTVTNCKFGLNALTGNTANGKNNASAAGAILNSGNLTINGSEFNYNTAYFGGAVYNGGNLTVTGSNFTGNTAMGGAIFNTGNSTITSSNFTANAANSAKGHSIGGAISNSGVLTVNNSKFNSNTATNGGAICNDGNATVINSTFTGNKVTSSDITVENYGGAIYNEGKLSVSGSTFTGNRAVSTNAMNLAYGGGAIFNFKEATVKTSKFTGNLADFGGAISNIGKLSVSGSTFTGNRAVSTISSYTFDGGAISNNGNLSVTYSAFTGNVGDLGGAISNWGNLTVLGSTLTSNNATSDGGAVYNEGKLTVHFCRIIGNHLKVPQYVSSTGYVLDDVDNYKGSADVKYNWWGSNAGPSSGRVYNATTGPWLVLTLSASPTTIKARGTSTITADFLHDSNGGYHSYSSGHAPDGMAVSFTTKFGTIGSKASTVNGVAKSTLKAGSTGGIVNVAAKTDSQTVQIPLKVTSTYPKNGALGCSRTANIYIKFSQNIKASTYWSKIYVKNLKTGKIVSISKWISGNTLYIKTSSRRYAYYWYQVYIPAAAVKDYTNHNLSTGYTFKFKTGKY